MIIYNNGVLLADKVQSADTFFQRFIGLMGKIGLDSSEGLLLKNCSSVHCFFMKFPIDVIYLASDMTVLYKETIRPWHIGRFVKDAKHVLELPEGQAANLQLGSQLLIKY